MIAGSLKNLLFTGMIVSASSAVVAGHSSATERTWNADLVYPAQGWTADTIQRYYHQSEGTFLMPYAWAEALVEMSGKASMFAMLESYGVLKDDPSEQNSEGLPVGLLVDRRAPDKQKYPLAFVEGSGTPDLSKNPWLGITCALCHVGEVRYQGSNIRIPGGSSPVDYVAMLDALFVPLQRIAAKDSEFQRFAGLVLGADADEANKSALKKAVLELLQPMCAFWKRNQNKEIIPVAYGPYRLDALLLGAVNARLGQAQREGRIKDCSVNDPFEKPLRVADAPVNYPSVWHAPWRDSVQYTVRIHSPLARNLIQSVSTSMIQLPGKQNPLAGLNIPGLIAIEEWLRELGPPRWPEDILGRVDFELAARGKVLYGEHCGECHNSDRVTANAAGYSFLQSFEQPVDQLGTDPKQYQRTLDIGGEGTLEVLQAKSNGITNAYFRAAGVSQARQTDASQGKPNLWEARIGYGTTALDGIWATPPYLHNGSVPSLYDLLLPPADRPKSFYVGGHEYDPHKVGLISSGSFKFDTSLEGNSNAGHTYGTQLSDADRWALVEYLKVVRDWGNIAQTIPTTAQ